MAVAKRRLAPEAERVNKVCFYWQAGRCNRYPCPFLHSDSNLSISPPSSNGARTHLQAPRSRSLVWKNPNTKPSPTPTPTPSPSPSPNPSPSPSPSPSPQSTTTTREGKKSVCNNGGESCFISDSFSLLTPLLPGHQNVITGIALPSGSDKLYTASHDESVRVWDCNTGQCVKMINLGSKVGCLVSEGPWIFIGIPNAVKAWNTQTGADLTLTGPTGQVYALIEDNEMLFAGTHDCSILAWKFSVVTNSYEPVASLTGHTRPVVSLIIGSMRLYSGSMDNTIRVWDLTTLQCLHTLTGHTSVVMSLLCWDQFLLSCSLDNTIKVWAATESGNIEVVYTHTEENGVLALMGIHDAQAKPVLICACNDSCVRLYDLPSFSERGKIFSKQEVRVIQIGPGGLFFTGDATGELKVWKWLTNETPVA